MVPCCDARFVAGNPRGIVRGILGWGFSGDSVLVRRCDHSGVEEIPDAHSRRHQLFGSKSFTGRMLTPLALDLYATSIYQFVLVASARKYLMLFKLYDSDVA